MIELGRLMGTREVYEEKLRRGNLDYDPTTEPGVGSARCPRCLSPLNPIQGKSNWELDPALLFVSRLVGFGIGGVASYVYGLDIGIPYFLNRVHVNRLKWFPPVMVTPSLLMISAASAAFGGYALPKLHQLSVTSYHTVLSQSHYGISLLTRHIEDNHLSRIRQK